MTTAEVAARAMHIEVTLPNGVKQEMEVQAVVFLPPCKNPECTKERFRTPDPRKEYCSYECQERAKYRRWQTR